MFRVLKTLAQKKCSSVRNQNLNLSSKISNVWEFSNSNLLYPVNAERHVSSAVFYQRGIFDAGKYFHNDLSTVQKTTSLSTHRSVISDNYLSPTLSFIQVRGAKRLKAYMGPPWRAISNEEVVPNPSIKNVKGRKHRKRMAAREEFMRNEVKKKKALVYDALKKKLEARRERWKKGVELARRAAEIRAEGKGKLLPVH